MIPNLVSLSRLVLLCPVLLLTHFAAGPVPFRLALAVLLVAGLTDCLDGWLARRLRCVSTFGAFLDPMADKVLANATLVCLGAAHPQWIHPLVVVALLARDFAVQGFRSMAPCAGVVLRTGMVSKLKFVFQWSAIVCALTGLGWPLAARPMLAGARLSLALALLTGYGSMIALLWRNRDLWRRPPIPMEIRS